MISGPVCQNNKCIQFNKFVKDSIKKVVSKENTYFCKTCLKKFKWSMPKKQDGIIY